MNACYESLLSVDERERYKVLTGDQLARTMKISRECQIVSVQVWLLKGSFNFQLPGMMNGDSIFQLLLL